MLDKKDFRNIIFLDVDGVLNNTEWYKQHRCDNNLICPELAEKMKNFAISNKAGIVISSSWRDTKTGMKQLKDIFGDLIVGTTSLRSVVYMSRAFEIGEWWGKYGQDYDKFVVFDDEKVFGSSSNGFIQTSFDKGITDRDLEKASLILNRHTDPEIIKKLETIENY